MPRYIIKYSRSILPFKERARINSINGITIRDSTPNSLLIETTLEKDVLASRIGEAWTIAPPPPVQVPPSPRKKTEKTDPLAEVMPTEEGAVPLIDAVADEVERSGPPEE